MIKLNLQAVVTCDGMTCGRVAPLTLAEGHITMKSVRAYMASIGWSSVELDGRWWDHCPECKGRKAETAVA